MPIEAAGAALPKIALKSVPAVFLSWYFQPGHVWDGQMRGAPLSQFEGETLACGTFTRAPAVWRTQEVWLPVGPIVFPLKARYDASRYALPPLSPSSSDTTPVLLLPGMQPLPQLEHLASSDSIAVEDSPPPPVSSELTVAEAQGACPHFAIPLVEDRVEGMN